MGHLADRRDVLKALNATGIGAALPLVARFRQFCGSEHLDHARDRERKPTAHINAPLCRSSPHSASVLLIDGQVLRLTGFLGAMQMSQWVRNGLAREIPPGLAIHTVPEKLRLLGRASLAPKLGREQLWSLWNL